MFRKLSLLFIVLPLVAKLVRRPEKEHSDTRKANTDAG